MTQLELPAPAQLRRKADPVTSVRAAAKAAKASAEAVRAVAMLFRGTGWPPPGTYGYTDEQVWQSLRELFDFKRSQATIRHARKALSDAGLLRDTGTTRPTSDGGESRVWTVADADGLASVAEGA